MPSLLDLYHNWRRGTLWPSKNDLSWRHDELVSRISQGEQNILNAVASSTQAIASSAQTFASSAQAIASLAPPPAPIVEDSSLNVQASFPMFRPNSAGDECAKDALTVQAIQQTIPFLQILSSQLGARRLKVVDITQFPETEADRSATETIAALFNKENSDKSNYHNYQYFYGPILRDRDHVGGVLEIGLGTSNTDVVSNMGAQGSPGASLRAFRDFLGRAQIYGADVDRRILFEDDRIKTYFVDQTDLASFAVLDSVIPIDLDLIIDDGLHSPNANIATLSFGLSKVKVGGWVAIEDIDIATLPLWQIVAALLPAAYQTVFLVADRGNIFAVNRIA